jgi:DNA-binding MarR family transcriptional regulator
VSTNTTITPARFTISALKNLPMHADPKNPQVTIQLKTNRVIKNEMKSKTVSAYLRFLHLAKAIKEFPLLPVLEPVEEKILEVVADAHVMKARLSVKDLMNKSELGSPAMLHGRLQSMREKGWIALAPTEDARRKQLELTPASLHYFEKLSKLMNKAVKASEK